MTKNAPKHTDYKLLLAVYHLEKLIIYIEKCKFKRISRKNQLSLPQKLESEVYEKISHI